MLLRARIRSTSSVAVAAAAAPARSLPASRTTTHTAARRRRRTPPLVVVMSMASRSSSRPLLNAASSRSIHVNAAYVPPISSMPLSPPTSVTAANPAYPKAEAEPLAVLLEVAPESTRSGQARSRLVISSASSLRVGYHRHSWWVLLVLQLLLLASAL